MRIDGYTAEDSADRKIKLDYAELRISGWARWARTASPDSLGFDQESSFVSAMTPQADELQAGARHCAQECSDEEAEEVEHVLLDWKKHERGWWKIVRKEYFTYGAREKKARELGLNPTAYKDELEVLKLAMHRELLAIRRHKRERALVNVGGKAMIPGRLGEVPARKARS